MAAYRRSFLNVAVAALACFAGLNGVSALASTPTLLWTGAKRVNLLCNVAGGPGIDHLVLAAELCRDVKRLASAGSPLPLVIIAPGDPAVLAEDTVTLLVHASVTEHKQGSLLALSVRPHRTSSAGTEILFGAAPRAVLLPASVSGPALDAAIAASLAETLPWLARPVGPRRIRPTD